MMTATFPVTPTTNRRLPSNNNPPSSPSDHLGSSPLFPSSPLNPAYRTYHPSGDSHNRRASYKSHQSSNAHSPLNSRSFSGMRRSLGFPTTATNNASLSAPELGSGSGRTQEIQPTSLWRERFRKQCLERAHKDRSRYAGLRRSSLDIAGLGSSEGDLDMDLDDGDEEDEVDDELYRRVVLAERRRFDHRHKVFFERDVGSSIDPSIEDMAQLEREFVGPNSSPTQIPWEIEEEELATLALEYEKEQQLVQPSNATYDEPDYDAMFSDSDFVLPDEMDEAMEDVTMA